MDQQGYIAQRKDMLAWFSLLLLAVLLVYPRLYLPHDIKWNNEYFNYLPFQQSIPFFRILALVSLAICITKFIKLSLKAQISFGLFLLAILISSLIHEPIWTVLEERIGIISIPFATAIIAFQQRARSMNIFRLLLTVIFFQQILLCAVNKWFWGQPIVGSFGNINWLSAFITASTPAALISCWGLPQFSKKLKGFVWPLCILTIIGSFWVLLECQSRASFLAIFLLLFFYAGRYICVSRKEKIIYTSAVLLFLSSSTLFAFHFFPQKMEQIVRSDIRIPMWGGTVRLIQDYPGGVAAGNYQQFYTEYRKSSTYSKRLVSAPISIHPHNEILNITAELGWLAGIITFILIWVIITAKQYGITEWSCHWFIMVYIIQASLDMPLVQQPGPILFYSGLGLFLTSFIAKSKYRAQWGKSKWKFWVLPTLFLAVPMSIKDWRVDTQKRLAQHNLKHMMYYLETDKVKANEFYERTIAIYEGLIDLDPQNLKNPYELIRISTLMDKHEVGKKYWDLVISKDASYAHINNFIAQYYIKTQDYAKAYEYMAKEVDLYPNFLPTYQQFLNLSILLGIQDESLDFLNQQMHNTVLYKGALVNAQTKNAEIAKLQRAFREDDTSAFKQIFKHYEQIAFTGLVDPMIHLVANNITHKKWPKQLIHSNFNELDFKYFQLHFNYLQELKELDHEQYADVETINSWFQTRFSEHASGQDQIPFQTWHTQKGNRFSLALLLAQIHQACQRFTAIQYNQNGETEAILIWDQNTIFSYNLITQQTEVNAIQSSLVPWDSGLIKAIFFPEQFFYKNQLAADCLALAPYTINNSKRTPSLEIYKRLKESKISFKNPAEAAHYIDPKIMRLYLK